MTYEERVAEFNTKANKEVYKKGNELLQARIDRDYEVNTEGDYEELLEHLAWSAWYNDCYAKGGDLTTEEGYWLIVEYMSIDRANEFLAERLEAVA